MDASPSVVRNIKMTALKIIAFCLSILGCILCNRKVIWCWPAWIIADGIFAYIYFSKGIFLGSLREVVFIALCFEGYYIWKYKGDENETRN